MLEDFDRFSKRHEEMTREFEENRKAFQRTATITAVFAGFSSLVGLGLVGVLIWAIVNWLARH